MSIGRKSIALGVIAMVVLALVALAAVGCGSTTTTTTAAPATTMAPTTTAAPATTMAPATTAGGSASGAGASGSVVVKGLVDNPTTITVDSLNKMGTETLTLTHPKNGAGQYTGVRFKKIMETVKVQAAAKSVMIVASDGYTAEVNIADITDDAMLAIDGTTITTAFPGQVGKVWVKDIVSLEFK